MMKAEAPEVILKSLADQPFTTFFADPSSSPVAPARRHRLSIRSDDSWMSREALGLELSSPTSATSSTGVPKANSPPRPRRLRICSDSSWLVRNQDTGQVQAIKPESLPSEFALTPPLDPQALGRSTTKPWSSWWDLKRQRDAELLEAATAGSEEKLRALLWPTDGGPPASTATLGVNKASSLHLAATAGCTAAVEVLLEAGVALELKTEDSAGACTALHAAAAKGDRHVVQVLLMAKADVNALAGDGSLALHLAAARSHSEVIAYLLHRIDPRQLRRRNAQGEQPAEAAADIQTARLLKGSEDSYARRTAHASGVLLRNSRADAVRRLLNSAKQHGEDGKEAANRFEGSCSSRASSKRVPSKTAIPKSMDSIPTPARSKESVGRAPFARVRQGPSSNEQPGPNSFDSVKLLGRGAFGEVFHVKHKQSGKDYAMKVQQKTKIMSSNLLRYAMTERNILAYIRHPFIVKLHYAFQTPSHLVLVLQYCSGGNLQKLINRSFGPASFTDAMAQLYTAEILLALVHLHERQIVYRDLKPENVVLDEAKHAMLTDFGLSKEGVLGHRGTKTFCGSVAYIAPEILLGKIHNHTVDIYNLGVLLYNMLVGTPPFYHPEKEMLHSNIKRASLEIPSFVSRPAQSFILVTMVREPSKRLGAGRTTDVQEHLFFADLDFVQVKLRTVPVPEPAEAPLFFKSAKSEPALGRRPRREKPGDEGMRNPFANETSRWGTRGFRASDIITERGVTGWEFEALPASPSKASEASEMSLATTSASSNERLLP
mmetsp:Transcript_105344/g.187276  ORF Transcript_105344/g.187276 Transcript_105344/m.187276 type:complete len:775 (-) Transcript_105344:23-2347(-)|eukprot:CAMPEP_0197662872 /NCGR_PEP_ID=MMETSP1338-20131121/55187_1 /TAXON_ID=43686 ORGANISM="Pelagodinium beii, Strain RCC1491" /NCGR_SAMPLE_ID=MMETSP1338 /ASSEMBLY_ACC=CAM_ASM_000754 /LENGTH=774 /DNA_ID=CAMNT_0043240947 /DNA_START=57 /DNA_END=2381 /DNA_ORIENTATION=+